MTTQYSLDLSVNILENAYDNDDYSIISKTAKNALPIIKQSKNMYSLLQSLSGKFNDSDNNYNQEIAYILYAIEQDINKLKEKRR